MEFFYVVKATQKSGKQDAVIWFTAKSEARALLQLDVDLEDAGIETGRGKDYLKPHRTNFPVVDGLPEESTVDYTWCDRFELEEDGLTWQLKAGSAPVDEFHPLPDAHVTPETKAALIAKLAATVETTEPPAAAIIPAAAEDNAQRSAAAMQDRAFTHTAIPFEKRVFGTWLFGLFDELTPEQSAEASSLELDMDANYAQNVMLACRNVAQLKHVFPETLADLFTAAKSVWPVDGKAPLLSNVISFFSEWIDTHTAGKTSREDVTAKWQKKYSISTASAETESEAPAFYKRAVPQSTANISIEIAVALLHPSAEPGKVSRAQLLGAKDVQDRKEDVHVKALKVLHKIWDILEYNAHSIFGVTRAIKWNGEETIPELRSLARKWLTENGVYENGQRSKGYPEWEEDPRAYRSASEPSTVNVDTHPQPEVQSLGAGMFSIEGLMGSTTTTQEASHEQMETTVAVEDKNDSALSPGEGTDDAGQQTVALTPAEVLAAAAPSLAAASAPEDIAEPEEASEVYPEFFEPGRYEGLPNNVYHAANGISSTQVKDARVSLMYFNARHVEKTIARENSKVLDMGNLVHELALQPDNMEAEFSVEPIIPEGAFTTTATLREFIDTHNASLPPQLSADDIKALLEEHNATLPAQVPLGASVEETGQSYMALPSEFQRIEEGQKQTAAAMKACIKEYNATLPAPVKTSGSRDALLEQLAIINPDLVAQEAQKPAPLKVSGTKADLIQSVKSVNPDAVFADELLDAWRENPDDKILVTREQLDTALAIQNALLSHPTAGKFLTHPSRAVEVSYFGIDDETGLEIRVRPDLEIDMGGVRIGFDLKTISMWNVKQSGLRARLHREIIDRDYHLSADMYMRTAGLDQFFWIFVNKDEGYHWIAIVEAGTELLELGNLEYQTTMRAIANAFDTGKWPAPITDDYTDELNDFDQRRLEALRAQA
ncbi:TPA: exodeoxyribonuclease VIII [Escherichia coli]|nr:exodeoxyribonuclease VIII [Escherichia coli]HAH8846995.1 exodeoxyribonuclease VIII [Escherichia coli]